jgi:hypothetical protein
MEHSVTRKKRIETAIKKWQRRATLYSRKSWVEAVING